MKNLRSQTKDAMRAIPGLVTAIFILSAVSMNLLANKSIFNLPWLAATAGVFMSWISFLCMDAVCKRFGAKTATLLNTVAMIVNLIVAILYMMIVRINGTWAASYAGETSEIAKAMNNAVDATFASSWYVVLGSSFAMFCGGLVNALVNRAVGKKFDTKNNFSGFAIRSYLSTAAGQYVDNVVFCIFVSLIFFGWTWKQVFVCSFFMMLLETVFEVVFSPVGYKLACNWKKDNVGQDYIDKYKIDVQ